MYSIPCVCDCECVGFSEPKKTTKEHGLEPPELPGGPSASTAIIYKTVAEKNSLMKTIQQYQDMGKYAVQFNNERYHAVQRQLSRNLTHLAHMPDADQKMTNLTLPPGQAPPPGGMPLVLGHALYLRFEICSIT